MPRRWSEASRARRATTVVVSVVGLGVIAAAYFMWGSALDALPPWAGLLILVLLFVALRWFQRSFADRTDRPHN